MKLAAKLEVLISEQQIAARVADLAAEIESDHRDKELVLVGVLKGAFVFISDLARKIDLPLAVDFIGLSSYGEATESSGVVKITSDLTKPIEGKHVLVVEDIVDTGLTMRYLLDNLATRHPASVKICALLSKPSRSRTRIPIRYLGFEVPDRFVVGYGLDAGEKFRNIPFIGVVKE
jgi:hypoxanthine phosphoribosyltransferase